MNQPRMVSLLMQVDLDQHIPLSFTVAVAEAVGIHLSAENGGPAQVDVTCPLYLHGNT